MKKLSFALILSTAAMLALTACDNGSDLSAARIEIRDGHYWQRTSASSAIYQRGPKAQQMLHRDISRCVYQVRELQNLGTIHSLTPGDVDMYGGAPPKAGTPEGRMAANDTPDRDGYLLTEQSNFHDFETCMKTEGWERVEYLPANIAADSRKTYINTMLQEQRRSNGGKLEEKAPENDNKPGQLNQ